MIMIITHPGPAHTMVANPTGGAPHTQTRVVPHIGMYSYSYAHVYKQLVIDSNI